MRAARWQHGLVVPFYDGTFVESMASRSSLIPSLDMRY